MDDYMCLGFNSAGVILHVTNGTKECCKETARQIRGHYKSVRVVPYDKGRELVDEDYKRWFREWFSKEVFV